MESVPVGILIGTIELEGLYDNVSLGGQFDERDVNAEQVRVGLQPETGRYDRIGKESEDDDLKKVKLCSKRNI